MMGLHPGGAASIAFADPFSLPIQRMVDSLPDDLPGLWGGVASGASQPGHNVLVADGEVLDGGFVAAHLHGKVGVDGFVCPGVVPVGDLQVVTEVTKDAITSLGNRPVLAVLKEVLFGEPEERREWVKDGLLLGIAIDEHKRPLGRGDFLVRELLGVRPEKGQLVCGTPPKVGSTVRFHLRDSDAACEDLVMLLDAQQLKSPPRAPLPNPPRLHGEPENRRHHRVWLPHRRVAAAPRWTLAREHHDRNPPMRCLIVHSHDSDAKPATNHTPPQRELFYGGGVCPGGRTNRANKQELCHRPYPDHDEEKLGWRKCGGSARAVRRSP